MWCIDRLKRCFWSFIEFCTPTTTRNASSMVGNLQNICPMCNTVTNTSQGVSHKCIKYQQTTHAICRKSVDGQEGYRAPVVCQPCQDKESALNNTSTPQTSTQDQRELRLSIPEWAESPLTQPTIPELVELPSTPETSTQDQRESTSTQPSIPEMTRVNIDPTINSRMNGVTLNPTVSSRMNEVTLFKLIIKELNSKMRIFWQIKEGQKA